MTIVDRAVIIVDPAIAESRSRPGVKGRRLRLDRCSLVGAAVALVGAGIGAQRLSDNSFLTHLASGREMIEHGVIHSDRFTWTSAGESIVMQSWLASLLYGMVDAAAGLWGLRLLMASTAAVLAYLTWRLTERSLSLGTRVAVMVPVLVVGLRTWSERPLLIGLVLFAIVMLVVEGSGRPMTLAAVGALWVNIHGSWPLGLVFLATRLIGGRVDGDAGTDRDLAAGGWLAIGCLVGGLVNPYGPRLLFFPLRMLGRRETLSLIVEWTSPAFDTDWTYAFLLLLLMAVLAVARRSSWRLTVPMLVFVAAALTSQRNIPVATLVLLPAIAHGLPALGRADGRARSDVVRSATVVMAALVVVLPLLAIRGPHFDGERYPVDAIDAAEDAGLSPRDVRFVHQDFVGNYLGLRYRDPVAWIDDRFELHPTDLVADYVVLLEASSGWPGVLSRHDAEILLWPTDAALTQLVREVAGWSLVFEDDEWSVLCRPDIAGCRSR